MSKTIEKEAYAFMVAAQAEFHAKALRMVETLYGDSWGTKNISFDKDEVHVTWRTIDSWGYEDSDVRSFPASYLWMADEQILES